VTLALVPFAIDQTSSLTFAEAALRVRLAPGEELRDFLPAVTSSIRSARAMGGLLRSDGRPSGVVLWEPSGPLGVSVRLLYLDPPTAESPAYREALAVVERAAGPVAFVSGPIAGLSESDEEEMMRGRGFERFGRSEMAFPPTTPVPRVAPPPGSEVRPVRAADEASLARLHERAYHGHLDRFLSIEDLDPVRDADRQVHDYFVARYGEVVTPGSTVVTTAGSIVAAVIAVRRPTQILLVDVMSDPSVHGRGFGRAALAATLEALRARGESAIVLNVTEENARAVRLYSGLGFVRTLGPSKEWYDARRMPTRRPSAGTA